MLRQAIRAISRRLLLPFIGFIFFLPAHLPAKVIDQLIAVVDGEPYTLTNLGAYAKTKMGREFPTGDLNQINDGDRDVLEQFITDKLLESEIREAGIKVTDEDVDQYIEQIKAKNRLSDEELKAALGREGQTMAAYRAQVKSELERSQIVNRQVRTRVNITNDDVERYYKLNAKSYRSEERAHIRHILISLPENASSEQVESAMATATDLRKRIAAGEDFGKLAREFSDGAGRTEGGDIGWVKRGTLINRLEEVAFGKLSVGQVSEPFRTSMGIHIVKLEARDPGTLLSLSTVAPKIKEELYAKALDERFAKWVKTELRRKHRVDVKLPGVVFKAEEDKQGTVDSLMARSTRLDKKQERGWFSFLNPFKETDTEEEDPNSPLYGKKIVTVFGVPLGTTDAKDDVPDILNTPPEKSAGSGSESGKSGGFFSSVVDSLNPFKK
jgi:peptidyl-prolyl cis-trans isomerase SurA